MPRCEHDWEPSDKCPWCHRERTYQQFGNPLVGLVGLEKQGPSRTKINDDEEPCSPCDKVVEEEIMAEYVRKSFTTRVDESKTYEDED